MASRATTPLSDSEDILPEPGRGAGQAEWRAYNRQQVDLAIRRSRAPRAPAAPIIQRSDKPFHIKTIGQTPDKFGGNSYAEWVVYVRAMENQFDQNDCDNYAPDPDRSKVLYAETFLKKEATAQLLWQAERTNYPQKKYTWEEFKNFLRVNTKGASTRKEDTYDKYLEYKQGPKQSVMDYDAHRVALRAELTPEFKPNAEVDLSNFIKGLREDHRDFVYDHGLEDKATILDRLKSREDRDAKKRSNNSNNKPDTTKDKQTGGFNKRKRDNENSEGSGDKTNEAANSKNNKGGKRFKSGNPNREPVKDKDKDNNRLYRFTKAEYEDIKANNKCFGCGQANCSWEVCKNKKPNIHSKEVALGSEAKN